MAMRLGRLGLAAVVVLAAPVGLGCQSRSAQVAAFQDGPSDPSQPIPPQFAGVRYPARGEVLDAAVADLLNKTGRPSPGSVYALVVPHGALAYAGTELAEAFSAVRDRRFERVILLGPSHGAKVAGAVLPARRAMGTPLGDLPVDSAAAAFLATLPGFHRDDAPFRHEHSIEQVLPFVQKAVGSVPIVPLLVGGDLDLAATRQLADGLRPLLDARTLLVVSTNLTHYGERFGNTSFGPDAKGKVLLARMRQEDEILLKPLAKTDLERFDALARSTQTTTCGRDALRVLLALLPPGSQGMVRRYGTSNDQDGSVPDEAVSYAALVFPGAWPEVPPLSPADQEALLTFARATLQAQVNGTPAPTPSPMGPRSSERHGVFVTLVKDGELRACVGRPESEEPLLPTVAEVVRDAVTADTRFPPIAQEELPQIKIELSVLGPLHPLKHLDDVRLGTDGLYVGMPGHTGLVLPQVATHLHLSRDRFLDAVAARVDVPKDRLTPETLRVFTATVVAEPGAQLSTQLSAPPEP